MRKFFLLVLPLFLLSVPASAQDDLPLVNLAVGGGYTGFESIISPFGDTEFEDSLGLVADLNFNLNENLGIFFSFGYMEALDINAALYADMGGLRYFFTNDEGRTGFFIHAMGGGTEFDGPINVTAWAAGGGVGYDMALNDLIDIRVFRADFIASFGGIATTSAITVSAGIVFHFGSR